MLSPLLKLVAFVNETEITGGLALDLDIFVACLKYRRLLEIDEVK